MSQKPEAHKVNVTMALSTDQSKWTLTFGQEVVDIPRPTAVAMAKRILSVETTLAPPSNAALAATAVAKAHVKA